MPNEIYQEEIRLDSEILEAVPLTARTSSYPFPRLRPSGKRQQISFLSLVLENALVRVTVIPDLGGRILRIFDKRTRTEVLGHSTALDLRKGGPRGAFAAEGIRWAADRRRLNDLGPVDFQVVEQSEEEGASGVWLGELEGGRPLNTLIGVFLEPDSAEIRFEMRTFNRSLVWAKSSPRIILPSSPETESISSSAVAALYYKNFDAGLAISLDRGEVRYFAHGASSIEIGRFYGGEGVLGPRQLDCWSLSMVPVSGLGGLTAASGNVACFLVRTDEGNGELRLQAHKKVPPLKALLLTAEGKTLEAPFNLSPDRVERLRLGPEANAAGLVIIDHHKNELLRWEPDEPAPIRIKVPRIGPSSASKRLLTEAVRAMTNWVPDKDALQLASTELGMRAASLSALGMIALREGKYEDAAELFEEALLYNAEDHLAWWMKAMALRLCGHEGERAELLNAHFLAPLEPVLRAEGFLSQPTAGSERNPLIAPLADNPGALIEVACLLYECGCFSDLAKWTDEALRHREVPMLRYIFADALLSQTRMEAEAAQQVQQASRAPINPPYPWRDTELRVLKRLSERFPGDPTLGAILDCAGRDSPKVRRHGRT